MTPLAIDISPKTVTRRLITFEIVMVALFVIGMTIVQAAPDWQHVGKLGRVVQWFDVDEEQSVQTFFSIAQLLLASGLVTLVTLVRSGTRDTFRWHWAMLALVLLAMAIDEQIGVHETLTRPMRRLLGQPATLGMFYDAWVIPAGVMVVLVGAAFARFLGHLPGETRTRIIVSAAVFVGGAVGFEMFSGLQEEAHGRNNLPYILFSHFEELMEMLGITLFVRAMLYYIAAHVGELRLRVAG